MIGGLLNSTILVNASIQTQTLYKSYVLCVDNYSISFQSKTGYIAKKNAMLYIPVEQLAKILNYSVAKSKDHNTITIKQGINTYKIFANKSYILINNKKTKLPASTYMQNNKYLVVPEKFIHLLGIYYKIYSASSAKEKGYSSGVIVISTKQAVKSIPKKNMHSAAATLDAARTSTQIVMVDYVGNSKAIVSYHEKNNKGQWKKIYHENGYVGKKGIGKTKEWDYKTPKGTYSLGEAFGIKSNPGTRIKYTKVNKYHYAVDDHRYPKYYNTLVDIRDLGVKSVVGEHLITYGKAYNYSIWINYNKEQKLGKGSSIFLHCNGTTKYTQGCVSISEKMMVNILKRLKHGAKIVIF